MAEKCLINCPDSPNLDALRNNNGIGGGVPNLGGGYIAPFNRNMPRPIVPGPGLGDPYYWDNYRWNYPPEQTCIVFQNGRTYNRGNVDITNFTQVCKDNYSYDGPYDPGLPFFNNPHKGRGGRW